MCSGETTTVIGVRLCCPLADKRLELLYRLCVCVCVCVCSIRIRCRKIYAETRKETNTADGRRKTRRARETEILFEHTHRHKWKVNVGSDLFILFYIVFFYTRVCIYYYVYFVRVHIIKSEESLCMRRRRCRTRREDAPSSR